MAKIETRIHCFLGDEVLTLGTLRTLVEEAKDFSDKAEVRIKDSSIFLSKEYSI